ncbi:unnamed protein product [Psylliodes chrysocephalus]|uniref:Uncharacterized protein n=1 Tax=Psylliodes chrysocephalus TaxID=3402493 RepID=A0A9P0D861_9CUCU|nr:unnamed protein product [Psylliodes chrysocephala]
MYESPDILEDVCLEVVSDNILTYIEPIELKESLDDSSEDSESWEVFDLKYKFKDPEIFLIKEISEKLLKKFGEKRLLCDPILNIFTQQNTKLKNFKVRNCRVTKSGLQILKQHKIVNLECVNMKKIGIGDILDCLNEWSIENLISANFAKCSFIDKSRYNFMVRITHLVNLRSLNLAYTELNQKVFEYICEDLKHLEKLDISGTQVVDLRPLTQRVSTLTSLSICDLSSAEYIPQTVENLKGLRCLDVSFFMDKIDNSPSHQNLLTLLEDPNIVPELALLDLSGWKEYIHRQFLVKLIETHPKLQVLGIVLCSATFDPMFSDICGVDYPRHLNIAGLGNEEQIKVTLTKYKEKHTYIQKALYHLFQLTSSFHEARPDMFNLVLPVMEAHCNIFGVQLAATACLYNLTRGELSKNIHPKALSRGVHMTLYAMEYFPEEFQLQKNSLLTLCSDRILQDVNFDKFRCAKLVLDALCQFEDVNMDRMAVAICSILAAKVSTDETSKLGARPEYMRKLLTMVRRRVDTMVADITLKFTLSALWNLTDECAATCKVFLENKGEDLFLCALKIFRNNSAIETKVLGLLNNIAEVPKLRKNLLMDTLMDELSDLLLSENIDVSYFAAGIVAHLASDGPDQWDLKNHARDDMLEELKNAVTNWKVPESEMVAYRSFKPFFSLLKVNMDYQVQLWAVWAIHYVCTKNPKRYCQMLREETGHTLLSDLIEFEGSHQEIKRICTEILQTTEISV